MDQNSIAYLLASIFTVISIILTYFIYRIRREIVKSHMDIAKINDEIAKNDKYIVENTKIVSSEIAEKISKNLISDPLWLEKYMDMTSSTYSGSIYGDRIKHFYREKEILAKDVIKYIDSKLSDDNKVCLLIDSGTTTYPLFIEISNLLRSRNNERWIKNVYIITNNIPGVHYLMKYAKEDPNNPYSEISIKCLLLPGKPLSVYAAITGNESNKWLENIDSFLESEWKCERKGFEIIGFITGNYMSPDYDKNNNIIGFNPVARGEGHVEIKEKIAEKSDSIILISPLMKYSFANVDILNDINDFKYSSSSPEAKNYPNEVKYEEISVDYDKCVFFTTKREEKDHFYRFYQALELHLNRLYKKKVIFIDDFKIRDYYDSTIEIEKEIPHVRLRNKYLIDKKDIWDESWILKKLN